jgi:hypothetical protein
MAVFFGYTDVIFGTQSTIDGNPVNYAFAPTGTNWRYSGSDTWLVIQEEDGASNFNGDPTNEQISAQEQIGGTWEQTANIGGTDRQIIWDYTFTVNNGTTTWEVAVIDVDLNNDDDLNDAGEDGYFLIFPDGMPPVDTDLNIGGIVNNGNSVPHADLGANIVCFVEGSLIETETGPRPIEDLEEGEMILTRDGGLQPLRWSGFTSVVATGDLAPIVITAGTFGNTEDLIVSPQHAILITGWRAELFYGEDEVLVRAIDLLRHDGVYRRTGGVVNYWHILFDAHHVVQSSGIWSESLYPGEMTMQAISQKSQDEIKLLIDDLDAYGPKAAPCVRKFEATAMCTAYA